MRSGRETRWLVVLGATIALVVSNGPIILFSFGVFLKPVSDELGWSRGTMSLGASIALTLAGLATPLVGRLVDKWGTQKVTLVIITLFAASFSAISLTPNNVAIYVLGYALCGLFASGQGPLPYAKAISGWFTTQRGLALGIAMAGIGVGIALMPQVASALLQRVGWRSAYALMGLLTWLLAFPAVLLFVRDPPATDPTKAAAVEGDEVRHAIRRRDFWLTTAAAFLVVTAMNGVIAHLVALLSDRGMPSERAVSTLLVVGVAAIAGRLVSGVLLDRFFAPYLAAFLFLVPLVATIVLMTGTIAAPFVLLAAVCLGFGLGAEVDVIGFLVGRYFGLRRYGEIYGYIFAAFTVGSGVGPFALGVSFDMTGGYQVALGLSSGLLVLSSVLIASLGPYTYTTSNGPIADAPLGSAVAPLAAVRT